MGRSYLGQGWCPCLTPSCVVGPTALSRPSAQRVTSACTAVRLWTGGLVAPPIKVAGGQVGRWGRDAGLGLVVDMPLHRGRQLAQAWVLELGEGGDRVGSLRSGGPQHSTLPGHPPIPHLLPAPRAAGHWAPPTGAAASSPAFWDRQDPICARRLGGGGAQREAA